MDLIKTIEKEQLQKDIPHFKPGYTVRVYVKVVEGERERVQPFEGVVIRKRGEGLSETFTVRRVSYGVAVERTFPVHSKMLSNIKILRKGKVRRARLYYLRGRVGKAAKIKDKKQR